MQLITLCIYSERNDNEIKIYFTDSSIMILFVADPFNSIYLLYVKLFLIYVSLLK